MVFWGGQCQRPIATAIERNEKRLPLLQPLIGLLHSSSFPKSLCLDGWFLIGYHLWLPAPGQLSIITGLDYLSGLQDLTFMT